MKKQFDAERAVRLYKGGMKVVDIAVEMGYERGSGQNRTRAALVKAGVYDASAGRATGTSKPGPALVAGTSHDPEVLTQECYKVVASRYKMLRGKAREGWLENLVGLLMSGMGAKRAQQVKPVALPTGLKLIRKQAA